MFNGLSSKSAKLQFVKKQILIRYLGLGWTKAYHPWSKNKYVYSPAELMEHFVKVVLPLQNTEVVPEAPPMNLPGLPTLPALGTVAHDITTLEEENNNAGLQLRINAMVEQERLEDDGIGDELMEMQEQLCGLSKDCEQKILQLTCCLSMRTTMGVRWCGARGGLLISLRSRLISMCM